MIFKRTTKGNYLLNKDGLWIRDFTSPYIGKDINNLFSEQEYQIICENELKNKTLNNALLEKEIIRTDKIIILSNGFSFKENLPLLSKIDKRTLVIAVNGVINHWSNFKIDYYLLNNPFVPKIVNLKTYPKIIMSKRLNSTLAGFLKKKRALMYQYSPTMNDKFGVQDDHFYEVDDYRNPIAAAFHLSYMFGAKKIGLLFCDNSFKDYKISSVKLENGLYCYPQHLKYENIINSMAHWLKVNEEKYELFNCSSGNPLDNFTNLSVQEFIDQF